MTILLSITGDDCNVDNSSIAAFGHTYGKSEVCGVPQCVADSNGHASIMANCETSIDTSLPIF